MCKDSEVTPCSGATRFFSSGLSPFTPGAQRRIRTLVMLSTKSSVSAFVQYNSGTILRQKPSYLLLMPERRHGIRLHGAMRGD